MPEARIVVKKGQYWTTYTKSNNSGTVSSGASGFTATVLMLGIDDGKCEGC